MASLDSEVSLEALFRGQLQRSLTFTQVEINHLETQLTLLQAMRRTKIEEMAKLKEMLGVLEEHYHFKSRGG